MSTLKAGNKVIATKDIKDHEFGITFAKEGDQLIVAESDPEQLRKHGFIAMVSNTYDESLEFGVDKDEIRVMDKSEPAKPLPEPIGYINPVFIEYENWRSAHVWREKGDNGISMPLYAEPPASFQARVKPWLFECFGEKIAVDRVERNHRFLEESLELVQSLGCAKSEAQQLVDYVYSRPVGDPYQEVGGVMVTLAALCLANKLEMSENGEIELSRIWNKIDKIRAKQTNKPKHSPLPEAPETARKLLTDDGEDIVRLKNLLSDIKRFDIQNYALDLPQDIRARIELALNDWNDHCIKEQE
jgi:hypothetical protein